MINNFTKDIFKYIPSQIIPGIVGFISIPIITKIFSPQEYGDYSLVMATIIVLSTLLGWLPISIIRFYPICEREKKLDILYTNIIKIWITSVFIIVTPFCLLLFFSRYFFSSQLFFLIYIGIGVFILTSIFDVLQYILRSKREVNWYSGFSVWKSIMSLIFGLILIFLLKLNIDGLLLGILLAIILIFPILLRKSIGNLIYIKFKMNIPLLKEMMRYSIPLMLGNLAAWILNLSDRYILEFFRGSLEVGIYSATYNISDRSTMFFVTLVMLSSGPILINIWENEGEAKTKEFISKSTRYYLIGSIPIVIGLSVLAKPIMYILTGHQYFEGYKIIPYISLGIFFLGIQQRYQNGFLVHKKSKFITYALISSGFINIVLNFIFIPKYGYFAAAVTTCISYSVLLIVMIIGSRRIFIWRFPIKSMIKIILAAVIMGIIIYLYANIVTYSVINLFLNIFLGVIIYFVLLLLLKEIQENEKKIMKNMLVKYLQCV